MHKIQLPSHAHAQMPHHQYGCRANRIFFLEQIAGIEQNILYKWEKN